MSRSLLLLEVALACTAAAAFGVAQFTIQRTWRRTYDDYWINNEVPRVDILPPTKMPIESRQRHTWRKAASKTPKPKGIRRGATFWPHGLSVASREHHVSGTFA